VSVFFEHILESQVQFQQDLRHINWENLKKMKEFSSHNKYVHNKKSDDPGQQVIRKVT